MTFAAGILPYERILSSHTLTPHPLHFKHAPTAQTAAAATLKDIYYTLRKTTHSVLHHRSPLVTSRETMSTREAARQPLRLFTVKEKWKQAARHTEGNQQSKQLGRLMQPITQRNLSVQSGVGVVKKVTCRLRLNIGRKKKSSDFESIYLG